MTNLHIFDMDGTLIDNDCDVSWKVFLVHIGAAPREDLALAKKYYDDYANGVLDYRDFLPFQLREFVGRTKSEMAKLCQQHFDVVIKEKCRSGAVETLRRVRAAGAHTAILSSTNTMISEPVRAFFGIDQACGTTLELSADGRFTGNISGKYALGKNKVEKMLEIADSLGVRPHEIAAYGDSANDIPLLSAVGQAYAVDPSEELKKEAEARHWPILNW